MPALGLAIVAGRLELLPRTVPALLPHFDTVAVLVDGDAKPDLYSWVQRMAREHGVIWGEYHFAHHAARCFNAASALCGTDWVFQLDTDETLQGAEHLREHVAYLGRLGITAGAYARRDWLDLDRSAHAADCWPDYQIRLRHQTALNRFRVHPALIEGHEFHRFAPDGPVRLEHWRHVLRTPAELAATHRRYDAWLAEDLAGGRIL